MLCIVIMYQVLPSPGPRQSYKEHQASNFARKCQLNRAKPQEVKDNSYILSRTNVKVRSIATSLLTNLGSCPGLAQRQYCRTKTTPRRAVFY